MARKNKSKRRKGMNGGMSDFTGEIVGNVLGQIASDVLVPYLEGAVKKKARKETEEDPEKSDVASRVIQLLAERGSMSIPSLLHTSGIGLGRLLHALKDVREFRLIELVGGDDDPVIQLTSSGRKTAAREIKDSVRAEAGRLLEA